MKLIVVAVLLGIALTLTGCNDSRLELLTQPVETQHIEPIDPLELIKNKNCVREENLGEWYPAHRIYSPCSDHPLVEGDEYYMRNNHRRPGGIHLNQPVTKGEDAYIIVEFDMEGFPNISRTVGFEFHDDEVQILNSDDIATLRGPFRLNHVNMEALYQMDDNDTVVCHFRYLGTTRETIGRNNLHPDEIVFGLTLRWIENVTDDFVGPWASVSGIKVKTQMTKPNRLVIINASNASSLFLFSEGRLDDRQASRKYLNWTARVTGRVTHFLDWDIRDEIEVTFVDGFSAWCELNTQTVLTKAELTDMLGTQVTIEGMIATVAPHWVGLYDCRFVPPR